jgi:hypothetical protein
MQPKAVAVPFSTTAGFSEQKNNGFFLLYLKPIMNAGQNSRDIRSFDLL